MSLGERLVWANYQPPENENQAPLSWPGLAFENLQDLDSYINHEMNTKNNFKARARIALCTMEMVQQETDQDESPPRPVLFLGRPVEEFCLIQEEKVETFYTSLFHNIKNLTCRPEAFPNATLYTDFHSGLDEATRILKEAGIPLGVNVEPWSEKALKVWNQYSQGTSDDGPHEQGLPQGAHSPNHSVAAVSMTEESTGTSGTPTATLASTNSSYPELSTPLRELDWGAAKRKLCFQGWVFYSKDGEPRFHNDGDKREYTEAQLQRIACEHYGWQPKQPLSYPTDSPSPSNEPPATPQSNAKEYSFRFLWKHHLQTKGWRKVRNPAGESGCSYQPPTRSKRVQSRHAIVEEYFSKDEVLDYCRRHNDYPTEDEASIVESDSPEDFLEPEDFPGRKGKNGRESKRKNFSFGVLWASHLEPMGWTMDKAKRNPLVDYYYVKPGKTVKDGRDGLDYFKSHFEVEDYCRQTNDYPSSSSESSPAPSRRSANESSADEESTKHPQETDDDHTTTYTVDTHTDAGTICQTPEHAPRTKPQDPAKPLSPEVDSSPEPDPYEWTTLWERLRQVSGWRWIKAKNVLQDYWYVRPGREPKTEGEDYFTSQEAVIQFVKAWDDREKAAQRTTEVDDKKEATTKKQNPKIRLDGKGKKSSSRTKKKSSKKGTLKPSTDDLVRDVKIDKERNTAPWKTNPVPNAHLHELSRLVLGVSWQSSFYYLPNETSKNYTVRFADTFGIRRHYCCLGDDNFKLLETADADSKIEFRRWVRYNFVPGHHSDHQQTRKLSRVEVGKILTKLDFKHENGTWKVPATLLGLASDSSPSVSLQRTYKSLPELCRALRSVESLEGATGRRRAPPSKIGESLLIALRLYIAEEWSEDDSGSSSNSETESSQTGMKRPMEASRSARDEKKKKNNGRKRAKKTTEPSIDTTKSVRQEGPWVKRGNIPVTYNMLQLLGVSFSNGTYYLPGQNGQEYTTRYSSTRDIIIHFATYGDFDESKLNGLPKTTSDAITWAIAYAHVPGNRHQWVKVPQLSSERVAQRLELLGFTRHPENGRWNVPVTLLEFENPYRSGRPPLLDPSYPTLKALCRALRSVPNLEGAKRRRSDNRVLTEKQMMALRLSLAEDLWEAPSSPYGHVTTNDTISSTEEQSDDGTMNRSDKKRKASKKDSGHEVDSSEKRNVAHEVVSVANKKSRVESQGEEDQKSVQATGLDLLDKEELDAPTRDILDSAYEGLINGVIGSAEFWRLLQKLGWQYSGGSYRIEGTGKRYSALNDVAQHILDYTILCCDPKGKLTKIELKKLHRYLKLTNVPLTRVEEIKESLDLLRTPSNISKYLAKLGVTSSGGFYTLAATNTPCDLDELVNFVRRATNLACIGDAPGTLRSRKDSGSKLSVVEELAVRIWAVETASPLLFFDEDELCSENVDEKEESALEANDNAIEMSGGSSNAPTTDEESEADVFFVFFFFDDEKGTAGDALLFRVDTVVFSS